MNIYTFSVKMPCYGCVNSIIKELSNASIHSIDIDFDNQLVNVKSEKSCDDILHHFELIGKKATLLSHKK